MSMPTTPPPGFLQAILEAPESDEPRLVFADWLMERGDPLGEFIAVQCEIARRRLEGMPAVPPAEGDPDGALNWWSHLVVRERELLVRHYAQWTLNLPGGFLSHGIDDDLLVFASDLTPRSGARMQLRFHRGLPAAITSTAEEFLAHADKLLWSSTVEVRCKDCPDKAGKQHKNYPGGWEACDTCKGTGRVSIPNPVPMPATAVPLAEVRLTTLPDHEAWTLTYGYSVRFPGRNWRTLREIAAPDMGGQSVALALLRAEFPSVKTWHLPGGADA